MSLPHYDWLDTSNVRDSATCCTGWVSLIDDLFAEMDRRVAGTSVKVKVTQIKEKFGQLYCYYSLENADEATYADFEEIASSFRRLSAKVCIRCGAPAEIRNMSGWTAPMCDEDAKSAEFRF